MPCLEGVGEAKAVKFRIGCHHLFGNPRALFFSAAYFSAVVNHPIEGGIRRIAKGARAHGSAQPAGEVYLVWAHDHARVRRPPEYGLARRIPGKDSLAVGQKQAARFEVTADGQQAVFRLGGGGEYEVVCESVYGHGMACLQRWLHAM